MVKCDHLSQILNTVCFFFTHKDTTDSMLRTAPPRDHRYEYRSGESRVPGVGGGSSGGGGWPGLSFISRTADGRFVVASSRASSVSSSSDDGGFLSRPYFRNRASWRRPLVRCPSDLSLQSLEDTPVAPPLAAPQTPFKASSPSSTFQSPVYFSDLSSVPQISSAERTLRSVHEQYSQELPSLRAIHEENQRVLSPRHSGRLGKAGRLPPRHVKYARSAPELNETSPESRSSSSGFGSKNTSQQTGSTGEWRLPPYRPPPPPPPIIQYWAEFTPSPSHSVLSKPISVDDHYEFDTLFPSTPTPTELTPHAYSHMRPRTPLRKFDNIEARVQAMKEEFYAYKKRQAEQAARRQTLTLESAC